jgi:molybdopterin-guanine dinucleotide biosynthesis protein A
MLEMKKYSVTGLILAGGKGSRMGGLDKGLEHFNGTPLALHALHRLKAQEDTAISSFMLIANRNTADYEAMGVPVRHDAIEGFAGPLAGILTGLQHCQTELLLTVPCDCPNFPLNLAHKLLAAMSDETIEIAMATSNDNDGQIRTQPVFCLMRTGLADNLAQYIQAGGRKIETWVKLQHYALVNFESHDNPSSYFANVNTLEELKLLAKLS